MTAVVNPRNLILYLHNDLVRAPLRLNNQTEVRLFAFALSCLHQKSDDLSIELRIADIAASTGGNSYDLVRNAVDGLSQKTVRTENTDPKSPRLFKAVPIFHSIEVNEETGLITGSFNPLLKPFLVQLTGHFTKAELLTLLSIKGVHANKLYWYLKSFASLGHTVFTYQELHDQLLGVNSDSYPLWTDFQRHVLKPAKEEICKSGWLIDYEEVKVGKKVAKIKFTLPDLPASSALPVGKAKQIESKLPTTNLLAASGLQSRVINRLLKMKLTEPQVREVLDVLGDDDEQLTKLMKATAETLKLHECGSNIQANLGAATMAILKTAFPAIYKKAS